MTDWYTKTFVCPDCKRTFKYGNQRTQETRENWRRFVLKYGHRCTKKAEAMT